VPDTPLQLRCLPLTGVMTFLVATVVLFFEGPYRWPINLDHVALFLLAALVAIVIGYLVGATASVRDGALPHWQHLYVLGALFSCVMVFPSAYIYTGKMPWEAIYAALDQGQAYLDFQTRVADLDVSHGPLVLVRTLGHWMEYAVIPLAVFRWNNLNWLMRGLLAGTVLSAAAFSLLRGTDQGTFDLGFLFAVSFVVVVGRHCLTSGRSVGSLLSSKLGIGAVAAAIVFGIFAINVFVERKAERYDGRIADLCIGVDQQICIDTHNPLVEGLDERGRFGFGMVAAYASQGYYGLALSLDRPFDSTWGLGHSSAITRVYEAMTGDTKLYERSFTYRLRDDGWSDLYQWSSIYTWIANDVGFPLTILVIGIIAWLWGGSWRDAVSGDSDAAGIVFCMLTQTFMYSPANFQLALGIDTYSALLIWIGIWFATTQVRPASRQLGL